MCQRSLATVCFSCRQIIMAGSLISFFIISVFCTIHADIYGANVLHHFIWKRGVRKQCHIPRPLEHGKYQLNPRVCPSKDNRAICRLEPGTEALDLWVLYYSCDPGYQLSSMTRASICRSGLWVPSLPVCIPDLNLSLRADWETLPESTDFLQQELPSSRFIIAHTVTGPCNTTADCILSAQSIQQYHNQQFGDIGYNFLVGGDGSVMEGQGWDKIGAHTINYNTGSVCMALVGNFVDASPPQPMLDAVKRLIERGLALGKLSENYKLYAHCQLIQIASPGLQVFNEIKHWPHWNAMNAIRCS